MVIHTKNTEDFLVVIAGLVKRGITFEADASSLTIKLTGGY